MIEIKDKSKCSGCYVCASICPKKCITMIRDSEGFEYPSVNEAECVDCGMCEKRCPILSPINIQRDEKDISAFAAYTKNDDIRYESSSGGLFTEIATWVINNGGVVFGAVFDECWNVVHASIDKIEDLSAVRGSKYVQSKIGNTYVEARQYLDSGRLVLFTGTPCQIAGLYKYLNKNYENLLTQDVICHGVPSPTVWKKYVEYRTSEAKAEIKECSFRNKQNGWKTFSMRFAFENGTEYVSLLNKDPFMKGFLNNYCLRPSCYGCSFKQKVRESDFTLADFWGIQNVFSELNDDKGVSLVLVNSPKARMILSELENSLIVRSVSFDDAIKSNPSMIRSVPKPHQREHYIDSVLSVGIIKTNKKYFGGIVRKVKTMIIKLLGL